MLGLHRYFTTGGRTTGSDRQHEQRNVYVFVLCWYFSFYGLSIPPRIQEVMTRITTPAADAMLDVKIPVLGHGYVIPVDYMGGDQRIVDAARVSIAGESVKAVSDSRVLIRYLLRMRHTTPCEMVRFTFSVKAPIYVARQWFRHRTGSFSELSARYSVLPEEYYVPDRLCAQSRNNKQGSGDLLPRDVATSVSEKIHVHSGKSFELYDELLEAGLARETARAVLPVNVYTQWYWSTDLWNLMHFLKLRLDSHAQYEIRVYAQALLIFAKAVCPLALEAWEDYIHEAATFSKQELEALQYLAKLSTHISEVSSDEELVKQLGSKREVEEFKRKLGL